MLRLQYEALLRSAWLLCAASDGQFRKVSVPLSREGAEAAKNLPGADEMLKALERRLLTTPELKGSVQPLREIRDTSLSAMNAFVHTGLHPLARSKEGFPLELAMNIVKMSNGMLHMAARLLARLTPSVELVSTVERCYLKFADCLPVIT